MRHRTFLKNSFLGALTAVFLLWSSPGWTFEYIQCLPPIGVCDTGCKGIACFRQVPSSNDFNVSAGTLTVDNPAGDTELEVHPQNNPICRADPVYLHSGQFYYQCNDLSVPGRRLDVELSHTYFSGFSFNGQFGYGWMLNYYMRLHWLRNGDAVIVSGDGRKDRFTLSGSVYLPPAGRFEELVKNVDNTWTLTLAQGEKYQFDTAGKLSSIQDRNNNTITFAYSASKEAHYGRSPFSQNLLNDVVIGKDYRLTTITDTAGRVIALNYNSDGLLESIVDGTREVTMAYDPATNDLLSVTKPATAQFPSGVTKSFTYEDHKVKKVKDAKNQFFVENFYDAQGRIEEQNLGGSSFSFDYTSATEVAEIDRNNNVTVYVINSAGNVTAKKEFTKGLRAGEPLLYLTSYAYNADMLKTSETFPRGNGIKYTYDSLNPDLRGRGNLLQVRRKASMAAADNDTNDIVVNMTYESEFNQVKTMTDPKGSLTGLIYDYELDPLDPKYAVKGNVIFAARPGITSGPHQGIPLTEFTYNTAGQVTEVIDPNGNITQYTYAPSTGYLASIIQDPAGINAVTAFTYDSFGNLDTVTDAENHTTDYDHDELGWLRKVTNPLGYETKYTHDANGNIIKTERQASDPAGTWQTTEFTYDILNNLKTVKDPLNRITTYNYDGNENRSSIVDAANNTTANVYDERDLLFTVTDANTPAGVTRYDYDINGNLAKITDAESSATTYTYDLFDRLDITGYADLSVVNYDYDKNSNLDLVTLPGTHGTIDYVYDVLDRLINKNFPSHTSLNAEYVYDLGGRMRDANNAAAEIEYTYDDLNRVDTVTHTLNSIPYTVNYDYFKTGLRKQLAYPSAKTVDYTYDANDRLDMIKLDTVNFVDYNYDPLDRRIQKSFLSSLLPLTTYNYDLSNQLSDITNKLVNNTAVSKYEYPLYDAVGNREQLKRTFQTNPLETINYAYNDIYELTGVTGAQTNSYAYDGVGNRTSADSITYTPNNLNQYTIVGSANFTYDDNGNLESDGTNTYGYDEQNRLSAFDAPGTANDAVYTYDALNRRVSKTVGGATTYFLYDEDDIIADYGGTGALEAEYIHGDNVDEILAMDNGTDIYYYSLDGLGSVTEITDDTGAIAENYTYDAFGNPSVTSSTISNRYMFTGREFDEESGIYHYRARAYDPSIGRFLQRDPIGNVDSENLYQYTLNNPVNYVDPSGEIVDTLADIGFIGYDLYRLASDYAKGCKDNLKSNLAALGGDVAGAFVPGLTGVGLGIRGVKTVKQITVIGSRADTLKYVGKEGYNVFNIKNWTPEKNLKWLDEAINRGDEIKMVTDPIKHQGLMQKLNKPSAYLDLELPYLLEKGIIP